MKIALVSDSHLSPRDTLLAANWTATVAWVAQETPDLTIHLGDLTANGVHDPAELAFAQERIADAPGAWRVLPGNHDIGDNPTGQPDEEALNLKRLAEFREIIGPDWWSVTWDRWLLIGLNAQLLGSGAPEEAAQRAWVEDSVARHEGPIGVLSHKPAYPASMAPDAPSYRYLPAAARQTLLAILRRGDLRFITSGHTHQTTCYMRDGVENFWVPSCGFTISDRLQPKEGEKRLGTMRLELMENAYRATLCAPDGLQPVDAAQLAHLYPHLGDA